MAWFILVLAGLFEIGFTLSLKYSENFTQFWPSVSFLVCATLSFGLLTRAIKEIPLGTAYAVWTSIGAVGTALMGMVLFGESTSIGRIALLLVMVGAVVGLKLIEGGAKEPAKPQPTPSADTRRPA
jgi:quaternary ammonium compound-resistance protein SugE